MPGLKLSFSATDRIGAPTSHRQGGLTTGLVYGLVIPVTLAALAAAGWYIVTGESPVDLVSGLDEAPRIEMDMPAGPAGTGAGPLIQPPSGSHDAKMTMEPVTPPPAPPVPRADATSKPAGDLPPAALPSVNADAPAAPPLSTDPLSPPPGDVLAPPSFAQLPVRADLKPLAAAPANDLLRNSAFGPLPVAAGGKEARMAYARPFTDPKNRPKIAVLVTGLGLSREATEAAIAKLPPEVSLSFSPYASNLDNWVKKARASGHEVLLDLPMEPANFPVRDAGPLAVLAQQSPGDAVGRLQAVLGKTAGYVGLAAQLGSPVTGKGPWTAVLADVKARGLLLVGDGLSGIAADQRPASAPVAEVADETPFRAAIDSHLGRLAQAAAKTGAAVTYVQARPVTMERLLAWFATFPQKELALAPVSAIANGTH